MAGFEDNYYYYRSFCFNAVKCPHVTASLHQTVLSLFIFYSHHKIISAVYYIWKKKKKKEFPWGSHIPSLPLWVCRASTFVLSLRVFVSCFCMLLITALFSPIRGLEKQTSCQELNSALYMWSKQCVLERAGVCQSVGAVSRQTGSSHRGLSSLNMKERREEITCTVKHTHTHAVKRTHTHISHFFLHGLFTLLKFHYE